MNTIPELTTLLVLLVAGTFGILFRRLVSARRFDSFSPEWLSRFSLAKYRPMERLLNEEDYVFLSSQRGFDPRISRRLRSERRKIFRHYLSCLRKDFSRLESALRLYMVCASEDKPALAKAVLRQRLVFTFAVTAVECRLLLHGLGIGAVDVRGVVAPLEAMRVQLGQLAMVRQAAAA